MKKIRQCVIDITRKYGCSEPSELCEKMGIIIVDHELPEHINGFTVSMEGIPFIVLNSSLPYYERRVTMAHELGHIVLHHSTNSIRLSLNTSFCVNKLEREADCFAAYLLLEAERSELEGLESVTADDISNLTHIPRSMIENAFFG
ncbi:MAG: ImmA/IrrE family metallo-endopeptidase [Clostridia bacterium]|nr:ImmA/IrrE family metallo-endopeptidase [Clostridia bacterium]